MVKPLLLQMSRCNSAIQAGMPGSGFASHV
jgi:hypothetical protein